MEKTAYAEPDADKEWPRWFFGPNGTEGVFDNADDVPEGWVDHPSKVESIDL